jgi:2-polyprenyl-3-methyl-5-hydroxy-6-metoxy-1,4-benzoquinol methylase
MSAFMSLQPLWDEVLRAPHWQRAYPNEEMIRFVARRFYSASDRGSVRILDLGCGAGTQTWYLAREGFKVSAIDGSQVGIDYAKQRLAQDGLTAEFKVGNLRELPWPDSYFDGIIDVAAINHNDGDAAVGIVREVRRTLKPTGYFFSIAVASDCSPELLSTFGYTRRSSRDEIVSIYGVFNVVAIERQTRTLEGGKYLFSHWLIEASE